MQTENALTGFAPALYSEKNCWYIIILLKIVYLQHI